MLPASDRDTEISVALCGSFDVAEVVQRGPSNLDSGIIGDPIKAVMSNSARMIFLPSSTLLRAEAAKSYPGLTVQSMISRCMSP
jgi:hypothetical protein